VAAAQRSIPGRPCKAQAAQRICCVIDVDQHV
jgi:hypothetical protein